MRTTSIKPNTTTTVNGSSHLARFDLEAVDVTGTHALDARDVQPSSPAGALARAFASKMELPPGVWTLRDDRTGAYLDEEAPIGQQVETGSRVVVTPKSHLGGTR